jgi:hypothetical protein
MPMTILAHDVIRIKFAIAKFAMQLMNLVPNVQIRKSVSKAAVSILMSHVIRLVNRRNSVWMAHVKHVRRCVATAAVKKVKFAMERRSAVRSHVGMEQHRAEACAVNRVGFVIRFTAAGLSAVRNRRDAMTPFIRFLNAAIPGQFVKTAVAKKTAKAVYAVTKFAVPSAMSAKTTHVRLPVIRQPIRAAVPTKSIAAKMAKKPVCSMHAWNARAIVF